ncbi:MAG: hypothetical protein M4579_005241 [Chaenotheca gracillima]|nr:MAG: hypothetical protein M4579_005241 [Chaenotheca gracillima]
MAPSTQLTYSKDEKALCFHHELLYEAKVLDSRHTDSSDKRSPLQYRVHYKGWKGTWDDWVPADRLRKFTEENKELAMQLKKDMESARSQAAKDAKKTPGSSKKRATGSDFGSIRGSEERSSSLAAQGGPRGVKRGRDYELEKMSSTGGEETFEQLSLEANHEEDSGYMTTRHVAARRHHFRIPVRSIRPSARPIVFPGRIWTPAQARTAGSIAHRVSGRHLVNHNDNENVTDHTDLQEEHFQARPSIRVIIPDRLKSLLVDDWENVTKNLQLVPLPSKTPVNLILQHYSDYEKPNRRPGSAEADVLEEVVQGIREYFDKCLGRILLYRFERDQYFDVRRLWEAGVGEWEGKACGDVYGAEHLCRLFVSIPELMAQTNMDQQSIQRLREELTKMTTWLSRNVGKYFATEYENASQDYIERAKGM